MKLMKLKSPFGSLFVVALLVGLPFLCSEAQARGGAVAAAIMAAAALAAAASAGAAAIMVAATAAGAPME